MAYRWKVQIIFFEKEADGSMGEPVANSEVFDIETEHDDPATARDIADAKYNASPRVQHTPTWKIDGDYIRYANIDRVEE